MSKLKNAMLAFVAVMLASYLLVQICSRVKSMGWSEMDLGAGLFLFVVAWMFMFAYLDAKEAK